MESTARSQTYQAPASLLQDRVRAYFVLYAVTPLLLRAVGFASFAGSLPHRIESVGEYTVFLAACLCVLRIFATRIYNSEHGSCLVTLAYCLILPFVFSICAALLGSALLLIDAALEHQFAFVVKDFRESFNSLISLGATAIETSEPWRTLCYIGLGLLSVVVTHFCVELSSTAFPRPFPGNLVGRRLSDQMFLLRFVISGRCLLLSRLRQSRPYSHHRSAIRQSISHR
jgi:hypothetical protein